MDFVDSLKKELARHPLSEEADLFKFAYQFAYGPEHLIEDFDKAHAVFAEEYEKLSPRRDLPLYEEVSDDYLRVNLAAWKAKEWDDFELFELFLRSAEPKKDGEKVFTDAIGEISRLILAKELPFEWKKWLVYLAEHTQGEIQPVHHSEAYRQSYDPHYRLVERDVLVAHLRLLGILC